MCMGIRKYLRFKNLILKRIQNNESNCQNALRNMGISHMDNQGNLIDYNDLLYKLYQIYKSSLIKQENGELKVDIRFSYLITCLAGHRNRNNLIFDILEKFDKFKDMRKCELLFDALQTQEQIYKEE